VVSIYPLRRVKSFFTTARQCVSCVKVQAWIAGIVLGAVLLTGASNGAASSTTWIVFAASPQHGTRPSQLFRITTTGDGLKQITTGIRAATEPAFSPDGKRVAFTRGLTGIFLMRANGTGLTRLTDGRDDRFPVWSPDGMTIAFLRPTAPSPTKGGSFKLFVMTASGRRQHVLRLAPHPAGRPSWLPGGRSIVISSHGSFYEVSANNGRVKRHFGPTVDATDGAPFWTLAPNGKTIAVIGPRPGPAGCQGVACEVSALYLVRFGARRQRRFADDAGLAGWSPDSRTLVFARRGTLNLQAASGGPAKVITVGEPEENAPLGDAPPAWQP
jgi:Tol biopolymer transport system component